MRGIGWIQLWAGRSPPTAELWDERMRDVTDLNDAVLADAKALGTATLHEAAGRIGALPSAIKPVTTEMKLAGPAFTVVVPAYDGRAGRRARGRARPGD